MPKPSTSASKRDREFKKRERDQKKRDKAELKRQRREGNNGAAEPPTPEVVPGTEADAQGPDHEDASSPPSEDRESELDTNVGTQP